MNKPAKTLFWDPDKHYYWAPSDGEAFKLTPEGLFKSAGYITDKIFFDVDSRQTFSPHELKLAELTQKKQSSSIHPPTIIFKYM